MATWITLTVNDLRDREVAVLVEALRSAALGEGQEDPVPELISSACARVRAAVASGPGNMLDEAAGAIPPSLKDLALRLVLRSAKGRLNLALEPDETRDAQWDERTLREIAASHLRVELPGDAADFAGVTSAVEVVVPYPRLAGLEELG